MRVCRKVGSDLKPATKGPMQLDAARCTPSEGVASTCEQLRGGGVSEGGRAAG